MTPAVGPVSPSNVKSLAGEPKRRRGVVTVGVAAGLITPLLLAAPASAHDRLVSSTPSEGATVETAPTAVQLQMSAELVTLGAQVQVTGPEGVVSTGAAQVAGTDVTQALDPQAPAGTYEVQWRVTSSDGHPISGSFGFTATAAAAVGVSPTSASTTPTQTPTASTSTAPVPTPSATPPAEDATSSQTPSSWAPAVLAGVAGGLVGLAYVLIRRRTQRGR